MRIRTWIASLAVVVFAAACSSSPSPQPFGVDTSKVVDLASIDYGPSSDFMP